MVNGAATTIAEIRERIGALPDPEIPVITLADLGILRAVDDADGQLRVTLTPTYSGCPATEAIRDEVRRTLAAMGHPDAEVAISFAPAWSTDWISAEGRAKLRDYGIAPPGPRGDDSGEAVIRFMRRAQRDNGAAAGSAPDAEAIAAAAFEPQCPRCASPRVERLSAHGSTPCKALYRCLACREPFDYFKPF